jgi:hypothetical protein
LNLRLPYYTLCLNNIIPNRRYLVCCTRPLFIYLALENTLSRNFGSTAFRIGTTRTGFKSASASRAPAFKASLTNTFRFHVPRSKIVTRPSFNASRRWGRLGAYSLSFPTSACTSTLSLPDCPPYLIPSRLWACTTGNGTTSSPRETTWTRCKERCRGTQWWSHSTVQDLISDS